VQALGGWVGAISVDAMRRANEWVDVDGRSAEAAARLLAGTLDGGTR
jgi:hypothetical protein